MSRLWTKVPLAEAQRHPLYGVKNWLAVFAFGVLLGGLQGLAALNVEAHKSGTTITQLLAIDHPAIAFVRFSIWLNAGIVSVIFLALITKNPRFRVIASSLLLAEWPLCALLVFIYPFAGSGEALARSLFTWVFSCAVWVTYLNRSKRVRVTFEHTIIAESTGSMPTSTDGSLPQPDHVATPSPASASIQHHQQNVTRPTTTAPDGTQPMRDTVPTSSSEKFVKATPRSASVAAALLRPEKQVTATPAEEFWAEALVEVDGDSRRPGLWARAYSEAQGDDAVAKAMYLDRRARQLESEHVLSVEHRAREVQEQAEELERKRLAEAQRADALRPKGLCPNCQSLIPRESALCPTCSAIFTQPGGWHPIPTDITTQTVVAEVVLTPELSTRLLTAHGCRVTRLNDTSWEIFEPNGLSSFARSSDDLQRVARLYAVHRDGALAEETPTPREMTVGANAVTEHTDAALSDEPRLSDNAPVSTTAVLGKCPGCKREIPLQSTRCPFCRASFHQFWGPTVNDN